MDPQSDPDNCGACVDVLGDDANCGRCGHACAGGDACVQGLCQPCAAGATNCGGACVDTGSDPGNCGGCGQACAGSCYQGHCYLLGQLCSSSAECDCGPDQFCTAACATDAECNALPRFNGLPLLCVQRLCTPTCDNPQCGAGTTRCLSAIDTGTGEEIDACQ